MLVDPAPAQTITFGPDADGVAGAPRTLCHQTSAVTITLRSGKRFGAVLVSVDDGVLLYERRAEATRL